jgi:trimethylamine--corrinoid protein Co-methyltransferase
MEFDLTCSYEKLVIDDEILGRAFRVLRGIEITEETLAFDIIKEVGPAGDFLYQEHTVRHLRTEFAPNTVADHRNRPQWVAGGCLDAAQRARKIAISTIAKHTPLPLDADLDDAIRARFDNLLKCDRASEEA